MATEIIYPIKNFRISNAYSITHPALDLAAPTGTPIMAPEDGKVVLVNNNPKAYYGGCYVVIMGKSGYRHYMGHNSSNVVVPGQGVKRGQHVANVGMTGFGIPSQGIQAPSGPHTHYEVSKNGKTVDPSKLAKGDEMITKSQLNVLYRLHFGRPADASAVKHYVGKRSFDFVDDDINKSPEKKKLIKQAASGKLRAQDHLPSDLRIAYKPPSVQPPVALKPILLKPGVYEFKK